MNSEKFYNELITKFKDIVQEEKLLYEEVTITAKSLTAVEAIGNPKKRDFPIIKGKEKLMQAEFKGSKGQAFTDMPGNYIGTIQEILKTELKTNFDRAVFIATFNAVCRHLNLCDKTVHCKDREPEDCASKLINYIKKEYGNPKIALIGLQPALLDSLSKHFIVRVLDMAEDTIGQIKYGVEIEDGESKTDEVLAWCDVILATGSTLANETITFFLDKKPVIFYGTTAAAAASLMNLERFCPCSH
ncbi:DUF364 domain-containing protein [Mycoplasmatota bacterium zrk1]